MSDAVKLVVQKRVKVGTAECRRLRKQGLVPCNVYGHESDPMAIAIEGDKLLAVITSGAHVLEVECDGKTEMVLLRDIQWDTFGTYLQHVDLIRVDPNERVLVDVAVEVKGTAPGTLAGGVLEMPSRSLAIECPAFMIPDTISVSVGELEVGGVVHASDLELPSGMSFTCPGDTVVCQVVQAAGDVETDEGIGPAEPELIGGEKSDES